MQRPVVLVASGVAVVALVVGLVISLSGGSASNFPHSGAITLTWTNPQGCSYSSTAGAPVVSGAIAGQQVTARVQPGTVVGEFAVSGKFGSTPFTLHTANNSATGTFGNQHVSAHTPAGSSFMLGVNPYAVTAEHNGTGRHVIKGTIGATKVTATITRWSETSDCTSGSISGSFVAS